MRACLRTPTRIGLAALTLPLALGAGSAASAGEGDPLSLSASMALSYDDNLLRAPSSSRVIGDEILSCQIGAKLHVLEGRQVYDAGAGLVQGRYRRFSGQDYIATDYAFKASSDVGRAGHVEASLRQNQAPAPLGNYQTLLRDLMTDRTLSVSGRYALTPLDMLEVGVSRLESGNDNPAFRFNDVSVLARELGVSHAFGEGSQVGLQGTAIRGHFTDPQAGIGLSGRPYDASYHERRLALSGTLSVTPISSLDASVAQFSRSYDQLSANDLRGVLGSLSVETAPREGLSIGAGIRREFGGLYLPASSQVLTDSIDMHANEGFGALWQTGARLQFDRRRYGADAPGLAAHSELGSTLAVNFRYSPWRFLSLEFAAIGDWRRAAPEAFSYTDRRYTLAAVISP